MISQTISHPRIGPCIRLRRTNAVASEVHPMLDVLGRVTENRRVCVLIKNSAHIGPADIQYRDIGDYLTREQKLDQLGSEASLEGTEWESISPNGAGDWINHRDEGYEKYQPIGDREAKGKSSASGIFENYSNGLKTNRDAWTYNFSAAEAGENIGRMIHNYESQRAAFALSPKQEVDQFIDTDATKISWNRGLKNDLRLNRPHVYESSKIVTSMYRPFCKQAVYFDRGLNDMIYQLPKLFPTPNHPNVAIVMSSPGASKSFSATITDVIPNLHLIHTGQAFPMYTYQPVSTGEIDLFAAEEGTLIDGYIRRENVTSATLSAYRQFYDDPAIARADIFFYVYGIVSAPAYVTTYAADLAKMLPRIPKVKDFWGFSAAGRALADQHLHYEKADPYPLEEVSTSLTVGSESLRVNKMSFGSRKERSRIIYNQHLTLQGVPEEAYDYQVNGKSALEWLIDRYQVTLHDESQITNDPNDYSAQIDNPRYLIDLIKRIVTVSLETNRIVAALPALEIAE